MLRITKLTDYGMVILAYAASLPHLTFQMHDIALHTGLPMATTSKILKKLAKNGILKSSRGIKGGYVFTRLPDSITVVDIIHALEGPIALTTCNLGNDNCAFTPFCAVRSPWIQINRTVIDVLSQITLEKLAQIPTPLPIYSSKPSLGVDHERSI